MSFQDIRRVSLNKSGGFSQEFDKQKVYNRIEQMIHQNPVLNKERIDIDVIVEKSFEQANDGIDSQDFDNLLSEICAYRTTYHPHYSHLASRIKISSLHKRKKEKGCMNFSQTIKMCFKNTHVKTGEPYPLVRQEIYELVQKHAKEYDSIVDYTKDYYFDFFGTKTLLRGYLKKEGGHNSSVDKVLESPQDMFMRVAVELYRDDFDSVRKCYTMMSDHLMIQATPTLTNSCTPVPQLASCFLVQIPEDDLGSIYTTLGECADISKLSGGIGASIHNIRCSGSTIQRTDGVSNGIVPMLRVFNDTARYVDQGGSKRKGAFAIYLEPHHGDVFEYLDLKKNNGKEELRARDLFYALWTSDLFMKRVENNETWSLFSTKTAPGLNKVHGEEFEKLYLEYEKKGLAVKQVPATKLWNKIIESAFETGTPYMLFKDSCNRKSNQKNLGTIESSNLCTEIVEYTSAEEIASCNLASIALPKCVKNGEFDYQLLEEIARQCVRNINCVIDRNFYPCEKTRKSNLKHRPMAIGVQGLADVFMLMNCAYGSETSKEINLKIFETIYFGAVSESVELAKKQAAYESFPGSPASEGILQFDLWEGGKQKLTGRYDFDALKKEIKEHGLRNSLFIGLMPTASTSQMLENTESFEPKTSNLFSRRVLAGEFVVINKYLVQKLEELGLWNKKMIETLKYTKGSVQNISCIPKDVREVFRTTWEIKQRDVIDMAADRGIFVCQSQSMNLHIPHETIPGTKETSQKSLSILSTCLFYGWKKGLKTGMYYLRTKPASDAIAFTTNKQHILELDSDQYKEKQNPQPDFCRRDDPNCESCGS